MGNPKMDGLEGKILPKMDDVEVPLFQEATIFDYTS